MELVDLKKREYAYTVYGCGEVKIEVNGVPKGNLPPTLPRIELMIALPSKLDMVEWFGRGPGESYLDSNRLAGSGCGRLA